MHRIVRYNLWRFARIGVMLVALAAGFLMFGASRGYLRLIGLGEDSEGYALTVCVIATMALGFWFLNSFLRPRLLGRGGHGRFRGKRPD